jgi:hypothetical protein
MGVSRGAFDHYGVLVGGQVIHYTSSGSDISGDMQIRATSVEHLLRDASSFWRPEPVEKLTGLPRRSNSSVNLRIQ